MAEPDTTLSKDERTCGMLCHLLALVLGFLGPLIIWLIKKDEYPFVDEQGKEALNFELTMLIGMFACVLLCFVLIGIPLLFALSIFTIVMNIIGAVKTNDGIHFRYPFRIEFFR